MNTRRLLEALIAARHRARRSPVPARLVQLPLLERRVVAARLGGGARPVPAPRALFDDVQ